MEYDLVNQGQVLFKFWLVNDNVFLAAQQGDSYNGRIIGNHIWPIELHQQQ